MLSTCEELDFQVGSAIEGDVHSWYWILEDLDRKFMFEIGLSLNPERILKKL